MKQEKDLNSILLFPLKGLILGLIICLYLLNSFIIRIIIRNKTKRLKFLGKNLSIISKIALWNLGIKVNLKNHSNIKLTDKYLILSNHLSYLDILIISSLLPSSFITSKEVQETSFLGTLSSMAGSIFVDRQDYKNMRKEIDHIRAILKEALQMTLFPEATSSNGETVLPFKSSLLECIMGLEKKLLLISLKYKSINGNRINNENRDLLYWYDDMTFFPHLLNLLKQRRIETEITLLKIINSSDHNSRKELSLAAYNIIKEGYHSNREY